MLCLRFWTAEYEVRVPSALKGTALGPLGLVGPLLGLCMQHAKLALVYTMPRPPCHIFVLISLVLLDQGPIP